MFRFRFHFVKAACGTDIVIIEKQMNVVGWLDATLSLIEWNCMRKMKSVQQSLAITMINDYISIRHVAIDKKN